MPTQITIGFENQDLINSLSNLNRTITGPRMVMLMRRIGALVANQTTTRFSTQTAPDGVRWARRRSSLEPNRAVLTRTGRLRRSIRFNADENEVNVGTNVPYAGFNQQDGVSVQRNSGLSARPFLGINPMNERQILQLVNIFLEEQLNV